MPHPHLASFVNGSGLNAEALKNIHQSFPDIDLSEESQSCDFPWHQRLSPLARNYLKVIREHQEKPLERVLYFNEGQWAFGAMMALVSHGLSSAIATGRSFQFDPQHKFYWTPLNSTEGIYYYFKRQGYAKTIQHLPDYRSSLRAFAYLLLPHNDIMASSSDLVWSTVSFKGFSSKRAWWAAIHDRDAQLKRDGNPRFYEYYPILGPNGSETDQDWVSMQPLQYSVIFMPYHDMPIFRRRPS